MKTEDLAQLTTLIATAKPLNDDDWGSNRQIDAENAAFFFADEHGIDTTSFETSREGSEGMLARLALMAVKTHHCKECYWVGDETEAADSEQRVVIKGRAKTVFGKMCPKCTSPIDPTIRKED